MNKTAGLKAAVKAWIEANPLRAWRREHEMTLMETAAAVGVGLSSVQLWENGAHTPDEDNMDKLARLTGREAAGLRDEWTGWLDERPSAQ